MAKSNRWTGRILATILVVASLGATYEFGNASGDKLPGNWSIAMLTSAVAIIVGAIYLLYRQVAPVSLAAVTERAIEQAGEIVDTRLDAFSTELLRQVEQILETVDDTNARVLSMAEGHDKADTE